MAAPDCRPYKGEEVAWAHVKRDGFQLRVSKDPVGFVRLELRTSEIKLNCGFVRHVYMHLPVNVTLLGELWVPGSPASEVSRAIADQYQHSRLRFACFAVESMPESASLDEVEDQCHRWGVPFAPLDRDWDHVSRVVAGVEQLPRDWEGYVLKNGNLREWYKWKPVKTCDLRVVDVKDGKGKYAGMVGALVCATRDGTVVASTGGMTDDERWNFDVVGRIVEVAYQYVGSRGRLRHPRFIRWRPDKEDADESVG